MRVSSKLTTVRVAAWLKLMGVGVAGGLLSGFFGVGGGIVLVPLLIAVAALGRHEAHATSLGVIVVTAAAGAVTYLASGAVDWRLGIALAAGGVVGGTVGAQIMHRLSPIALRRIFSVVLVVAGLRMVL